MATRQEIQVGHNLCKFTNRLNKIMWAQLQTLQDRHPVLGTQLVWVEDGQLDRPWTADEIRDEVVLGMSIVNSHSNRINQFTSKADSDLVGRGLEHYKVPIIEINSDVSVAVNVSGLLSTALAIAVDRESLGTLGEQREYQTSLSIQPHEIVKPLGVKHMNIAHDCLDAISYELQGICSYTGDVRVLDLEVLSELVKGRCLVATVHANAAQGQDQAVQADIDMFLGLANDLSFAVESASRRNDFVGLGRNLDRDLPKLPLIRRHWAL